MGVETYQPILLPSETALVAGPARTAGSYTESLTLPGRYVQEARPFLASRGGGQGSQHLLLSCFGRPLAPGSVNHRVRLLAERADVRGHPHAFRLALATHAARSGVNVKVISELLGHKSLTITAEYVAVDPEELRAAVETLERSGT